MAQGNGGGLISSAFVSQDEINHIVGTSVTKVGQQLTALDKAASDPHNPSATADRLYAECLRSSSNPIEQPGVGSTETIQQTFNTPANNQSSGSFNTPVTNQPLLTPADQAGPSTK